MQEECRVRCNQPQPTERHRGGDQTGDRGAAKIGAMEDLGPGGRGADRLFEFNGRPDLFDLRRDGGRRRIHAVEARKGSAGGLVLALHHQPARRLGKHHEADPIQDRERDLADDRSLPCPVAPEGGGAQTDGVDDDDPKRGSDIVQGDQHAALLWRHTFDPVYRRHGKEMAQADRLDAVADHVGGVVARRAQHTCRPNGNPQAAHLEAGAATDPR